MADKTLPNAGDLLRSAAMDAPQNSATDSPEITPEIVAEHGLSPAEYEKVLEILGRAPNLTELGIFSVMWSEHCSYKSSKKWLKTLPTEGKRVICGPGENAGVVDIDDGQAVIFKMESHNHPSFIEPYQGAATGVGGILRDVFTMGARPVANLNALRFGSPDNPKTRHLVAGVVAVALSAANPVPCEGLSGSELAGCSLSFSPLLAVGSMTLMIGFGVLALIAVIAYFNVRLAREGGRSIQASTGMFYLAVILAPAAEFASKIRFF